MQADVMIIGAGAAGLMAANELLQSGKKVVVLEARSRPGGRIHTIQEDGFNQPLEGGAEFVHGSLSLTEQLLHEAMIPTTEAGGNIWRSQQGKLHRQDDFIEDEKTLLQKLNSLQEDITVAQFINRYLAEPGQEMTRKSLVSYVEGYYAGDIHKASTLALKEGWESSEDSDRRIEGGYGRLADYLYAQCVKKGCQFHFNTPVNMVHWQKGEVTLNLPGGKTLKAAKAIITLPLGVLRSRSAAGSVVFNPGINEVLSAVQQLGFGSVIKIALQVASPFWEERFGMKEMGFLFSEQSIPTWWTQHPQQKELLTGWCAGPQATRLKHLDDEAIYHTALSSLAACFALPAAEIQQQVLAWKVFNWAADPFTCGGYAYTTTETKKAIQVLAQPVEGTLYFAGEGLHDGTEIGTVEAALISGQKVARQIAAA